MQTEAYQIRRAPDYNTAAFSTADMARYRNRE
jgi:hypothetical protein